MRLIDADRINIKNVIGGNSEFANDVRIAMQDLIDSQPTVTMCEGCRKKMRKDEVRCKKKSKYFDL